MQEADGKPVILIAEDEAIVRNVVQMTLTAVGYNVLPAADGTEALHLSRTYDGPIDLLISDVKMPNMTGVELTATIVKDRPGIRILLMTGKSSEAIPPHLRRGLLRKPFKPKQLLERVQQILAASEN